MPILTQTKNCTYSDEVRGDENRVLIWFDWIWCTCVQHDT